MPHSAAAGDLVVERLAKASGGAPVLDAPEFRPGDRVDLDYVGGPTVGYQRSR